MAADSANQLPEQTTTAEKLQPLLEAWSRYLATLATPGDLQNSDPSLEAERQKSLLEVSAGLDDFLRCKEFLFAMKEHIEFLIQTKKYETSNAAAEPKQPSDVESAERFRGSTPFEVVDSQRTHRILKFKTEQSARCAEPVLICFSLVNRPYILDFRQQRSVIAQLLSRGLDVYLIEWCEPDLSDKDLGLSEYVCGAIQQAVDATCQVAGSQQVHLLGYCMGGTIAAMFAAISPRQVRSLILLAAPIDFDYDESLPHLWVQEEYFDVDRLIDTFGNCPGFFLQSCFQLTKPAANFVGKYVTLAQQQDNPTFVDNFLALERWSQDSVPVAGKAFCQFVKQLYRENQLVKNQMELGETAVRLSQIECPILMLVAENDHLVSPAATTALARYVSSEDVTTMTVEAGHIGLAVSSKAHRTLWPEASEWIARRSTSKKLVPQAKSLEKWKEHL